MAATTLVIACGALARELEELRELNGLDAWRVEYLPAELHNTPDTIPERVGALLAEHGQGYERLLVAYADCGTGGHLDRVIEAHGAERLPGAHCYEVFAGSPQFAALAEEEPGTFYLTDFLVRNFDRLVIEGLGLDRHPELLATYFGNYRRVVYLSQAHTADLLARARKHAATLGLEFVHRQTGLGRFGAALTLPQAARSAWPR